MADYTMGVPAKVEIRRFSVSADNEELLPSDADYLILGAAFTGNATAINLDAGADVASFPAQTSGNAVNATASGDGTVTLVYVTL